MARQPSAADMTARFQAGITGAGSKYAAGVARVTQNPMAAAAAKVDDGTWAANTAAAAGRMSSALKAKTLQDWQQSVSTYGVGRYTSSAQKAAANYSKVSAGLAQAAATASQNAAATQDPIEKVRASINAFRAYAGKPPL